MITIYTQAYNVEKYIAQCIESVLGQTYKEFEWILVENGSTDHTRDIIRMYEKKDSRIMCIYHDVNKSEFANNYICRYAQGEYIAKLDSDDFWGGQYLEKLVNAIEADKADLVCCKAIVLDEINNEKYYHGFRTYAGLVTGENIAEMYHEIEIDMNTYWAKLMKLDLFKKTCEIYNNLLKYNQISRVRYGGDTIFMYSYLSQCNKSIFLTDALYYYRLHRKNSSKTVIDMVAVEACLLSFETKKNVLNKYYAWNDQNAAMVYKAFWVNLDTIFRNIVQSDMGNRNKIESIANILSDSRIREIRRKYCDEDIRRILSTHIAWCYMNMENGCEYALWNMLVILEPELFSEITEEQYLVLISDKILLSLLILGEKKAAFQHMEKLYAEDCINPYRLDKKMCPKPDISIEER